jgi:signal transduction histidine kinase/CheY-like chemotaxis protein/HPt (histidine-containing phosphotransfer) domain-containing protein
MMKTVRKSILIYFIFIPLLLKLSEQAIAQDNFGHLSRAILYERNDTVRLRLLIELVDSINDMNTWPRYNEQAYELGMRLSKSNDPAIQKISKIYLADAINNFGFLKDKRGDYNGALMDYFEALKIREEIDYKRGIASSYNNIGQVFANQSDFNRALDYFKKSYEIRQQNNDLIGMAQLLNHIGNIYKQKKDYDAALQNMQQSLVRFRHQGNFSGEAKALLSIGDIYYLQTRYDLAYSNAEEAFIGFKKIGNVDGALSANVLLSKIDIAEGKFQQAIEKAKEALAQAELYQLVEVQTNLHKVLNLAYEGLNNAPLALLHFKHYVSLRDSISNPNTKNNILEQQLQYENGKKEAQRLAAQELKDLTARSVRNTLLASCLVLFLIAGILINRNYIRKKANEELAEKNKIIEQEKQRAEESEQFKTQFLSNISHEIRTPMNAILGMSDLLIETQLDDRQLKYVTAIKKSSENLLLIINDVLDFSKLEAGKVELENVPFKPLEVLQDVHNTLKFKAEEKGLDFKWSIEPTIETVFWGDNFRLYQILMNLVGNAIKFTQKGMVSIELSLIKDEADYQMVRYEVKDTGVGIEEDKISSIFNSFQQAGQDTSRRFGGTGLGLTIAQQLVKLRNSEIKVESKIGSGSTFYFDFQYKKASLTDYTTYHSLQNVGVVSDFKDIKILLVEDNEYNQIVAVESLLRHLEHCEIQVANNGKEAITLLEQSDYDIILMDINMPEMDGYEATRIIRNELASPKAEIPIIALTAFAFEEEEKCLQIGMNAIVTKPFKINQLLSVMAKFVETKDSLLPTRQSNEAADTYLWASANDILDLSFIRDFTEDDTTQMNYFIQKFITNAPKELLYIQEALSANEYEQLRKAVHTFKPQVEFVGIIAATNTIKEYEKAIIEQKDWVEMDVINEKLKVEINKGIEKLTKILSQQFPL